MSSDVKPVRRSVYVDTESKSYDTLFGHGILDEAGELSAGVINAALAVIVTDSNVGGLYADRLEASLRTAGIQTVRFTFRAGEVSKNAETYVNLLEFMAESGLTRSSTVFALGGGVAGDLAGFAAATYMRGVKFVQIPTSLLAMVDSSVGGKTGIDLRAGKNLAGAFYQPDLVICDISTLDTLPEDQLVNGWGEIIKYGMICDSTLLEMLKAKNPAELEDIIIRCVSIKRDIVGSDERGKRSSQAVEFWPHGGPRHRKVHRLCGIPRQGGGCRYGGDYKGGGEKGTVPKIVL